MFDVFGKRFFETLEEVAGPMLGDDHTCTRTVARAAQSGSACDIEAAQDQLARLPDDVSASLMAAVHKALREDPAALLDAWDGPGSPPHSA